MRRNHVSAGFLAGVIAVVGLALGCASGDEVGGNPPAFPPSAPGADNPNSGDDDDDADDDRDDVSFLGCCQRHDEPGCQDPEVESCICDVMPECCTDSWTEACIVEGVNFACMECTGREPGSNADGGNVDDGNVDDGNVDDGNVDDGNADDGADSGAGPGGAKGGCCDENATPGCTDAGIESCVCAEDDYCCTDEWDDICVGIVDSAGCGTCGGTPPANDAGGTDDGGGMAPAGTCCAAVNTPGCSDPFIEDCVCFEDEFCCDFAWDATCAGIVESAMCGTC